MFDYLGASEGRTENKLLPLAIRVVDEKIIEK
jgi:hypothetical protein